MKWFNVWFLISGVWIVVAIINLIQKQTPAVLAFNVFAAVLCAGLGAAQNSAAKQGDAGKKRLKRLYITVIVLLLLFLGALIVWTLRQG